MSETLIIARRLYDGVSPALASDIAIEIAHGRIRDLRPAGPSDREAKFVAADLVAPGMIDLQINGAADAQFNLTPDIDCLARMAHGARQGGTAHILPTFITAPGRAYLEAIHAARAAIDAQVPGIIGVHLEGPFLSPARPGIHNAGAIRPLDAEDARLLTQAAQDFPGTLLVTLAPECQNPAYLRALTDAGIVLFAGHSEAQAADLTHVAGATHLWNAMPPPTSRTPGIVSEVLGSDRLFAGLIADGHHLGRHALQMSLRSAAERLFLVTDAMMTLAGTVRGFTLEGCQIKLADGRLTGEDGTLAGAHIAMDAALRCLMRLTDADLVSALAMTSATPARALGRPELGQIRRGAPASLSLFDDALRASAVVLGGNIYPRSQSLPQVDRRAEQEG